MKPIISPWVIYLAGVGDTIRCIALGVAVIAVIASIMGIATELEAKEILDDEEHEVAMKWIKGGVIALIISLVLLIFIPSKETIYTMLIADNITMSTIENGKDDVKEMIDYIVDKVEEITE